MSKHKKQGDREEISRRRFLKSSGVAAAVAAGATVAGCAHTHPAQKPAPTKDKPEQTATGTKPEEKPRIQRYRTLGRTGFKVSDISLGGAIYESNVVRYACDRGINLIDTAEVYGNGLSETRIGEAMAHLQREKLFIVTKLVAKPEDTEQTLLDRYAKCLERMKTSYADALYLHAVSTREELKNPAFHAVVKRLKADGKLKHAGVSCHGPRTEDQESMANVLLAAVEDGRFDLMLLVYNFMKADEGEQVLKACKAKNIGTTAMKVGAGRLEIEPFDPDKPSEDYAKVLKSMTDRGTSREEAIERINKWLANQKKDMEKNKPLLDPFMAKHGIKTQDELDTRCVQWVLKNPDMHTVVVSMPAFDKLDMFIPLSGTELSAQGELMLREYQAAFGHQYCRHACTVCMNRCPAALPVSTVMRYSYYFQRQRREKYAMEKYARLDGQNASRCMDCSAPCQDACPFDVSIQASMVKAHQLLTLA